MQDASAACLANGWMATVTSCQCRRLLEYGGGQRCGSSLWIGALASSFSAREADRRPECCDSLLSDSGSEAEDRLKA